MNEATLQSLIAQNRNEIRWFHGYVEAFLLEAKAQKLAGFDITAGTCRKLAEQYTNKIAIRVANQKALKSELNKVYRAEKAIKAIEVLLEEMGRFSKMFEVENG